MTVHKVVSRAEFARMCNVTSSAISVACRTGGSLFDAICGRRIDVNHASAIAYRKNETGVRKPKKNVVKKVKPKTVLKKPEEKKPSGWTAKNNDKQGIDPAKAVDLPKNIEAYADMTICEVIDRFGTTPAFVDYLKAMKEIETIRGKKIQNAESEGVLIHRDLIKVALIDPIESAHIKLLTAGVKTIARRLKAMVEAGRTMYDLEELVTDQISSFIKPVKEKTKRTLDDVRRQSETDRT
jgi:hypothetical protein